MKWFSFIFAIYLLVLAIFPCADKDIIETNQVNIQWVNENHDHQEPTDHCSPLCLCNCCGINITIFKVKAPITNYPPIQFKEVKKVWNEAFIDLEYFSDIWQPPRFYA